MYIEHLNCVDLFSGAGGFSLGAIQAGFTVKLAIEYNKNAVQTYKHNLGRDEQSPIIFGADITTLSPEAIKADVYQPDEVCDLLLGGPPCQGFSTHRIKGAGVNDPRNNLILTYFSFVREFRPSFFLMENVPGMLWPRHSDYLEAFYKEGQDAGYTVFPPAVLDACDFGIGQRRKRVFILGVANDLDANLSWPPLPTHGNAKARLTNPHLKQWENCSYAFSPADKGDENDVHMKHGHDLVEAFANTPINGGSRKDSGRMLPCHKDHDGHKDVYGRINPFEVAPTMTTACVNPSKGRFVHPTENHGITVRQAARIQTFPDSFIFLGGLMAAGQQIGNAVPVELGRFLIDYLKPAITSAREQRVKTRKLDSLRSLLTI
ncbi:DNA cytosine methyltransferase [Asticcacaulis taihuensis]|uniref:Cytosine-specific methyltransferase n=2 Tax=Asticcacaulis taihuensis TaxID=260084 RepID=A0A1G4SPY0_9CAUL|nr:DNA (cytosine-5)-methyltransferase 1 [Asticcacaulis taihuensis]